MCSEGGPDHGKHFTAIVRVAGEDLGSGEGRSKKESEQQAADTAWKTLRERLTPD